MFLDFLQPLYKIQSFLFVTCPHLQLVYEQSQNFVYGRKFAILSTIVY